MKTPRTTSRTATCHSGSRQPVRRTDYSLLFMTQDSRPAAEGACSARPRVPSCRWRRLLSPALFLLAAMGTLFTTVITTSPGYGNSPARSGRPSLLRLFNTRGRSPARRCRTSVCNRAGFQPCRYPLCKTPCDRTPVGGPTTIYVERAKARNCQIASTARVTTRSDPPETRSLLLNARQNGVFTKDSRASSADFLHLAFTQPLRT